MPGAAHRRARTVAAGARADRSSGIVARTRELNIIACVVVVVVANIVATNQSPKRTQKEEHHARVAVEISPRRGVPTED